MKRITAVLLAALLIVGVLSSCAKKEKTVTVGTAEIGSSVYAYFLDSAASSLNKDKDSSDVIEKAETEALKYVAVNTKFEEKELELTAGQKSDASKRVNSKWHLFGEYYSSLGITKQALYKIELSEEYRKALIRSIYDTDGTNPVPEKAIKAYYSDNFVAFKAIIELLQTTDENGVTEDLTDEKIASLTKQFDQMKNSIDEGTSIEKVNSAYQAKGNDAGEEEVESMLISKTDTVFPSGTFDELMKIERDKAGVFKVGKYIFLAERIGEFSDKSYYENNRDRCLIEMQTASFDEQLEKWAEKLK